MEFQILKKHNISDMNKQIINNISNLSFPIHNNNKDFVSLCKDDSCICILKQAGEIVSVGYLDMIKKNVINPLTKKYILIHSLSVHPDNRGKGLCKVLVKKIQKKYPNTSLCLTVCTDKQNPNIPGIKCYERCGFKLIDMCHVDNYDGINTYMTYIPKKHSSKKKKHSSKKKKHPSKKKKHPSKKKKHSSKKKKHSSKKKK